MIWKPCASHNWQQLGDRVSYRCIDCGAAGYRRHVHNPFNKKLVEVKTVRAYSCPGCHGPTKSPKLRCPNCLARHEAMGWEPTVLQQQVLEQLNLDGGPMKPSASSATLGVLRKKGLIKQVNLWQITHKGREFLAKNFQTQKEDNNA